MKRDHNKIVYNETGIYKVNQVSERYFHKYYDLQTGPFIRALHQSSYQICNVYTNGNSTLSAYQKLNGNLATNQVFLDHKNLYIPIKYRSQIQSQIRFNDYFNCHGFTFLDAQFWLELDNETAELIIQEDSYKDCSFDDLDNDGVCLYFDTEAHLIHSARMVNGKLLSKFGINHLMTVGQEEILERYKDIDHSKTKFYNPS